ncbi:hypothetical protein K1719_016314 [Acacia pycnantha]|nr:hypothetical protein K1719_016314 [Acacia pycnantha]
MKIDLDLFDKVNVEESKASVGSRNICYLVQKAEHKWWDRFLKQGGNWEASCFFEIGADNNMDFSGLDFSKMGIGGGEGLGDFGADKESEAEEGATGNESSSNENLAGATVRSEQGGEPEAKA